MLWQSPMAGEVQYDPVYTCVERIRHIIVRNGDDGAVEKLAQRRLDAGGRLLVLETKMYTSQFGKVPLSGDMGAPVSHLACSLEVCRLSC